jgi:hypothetical protein
MIHFVQTSVIHFVCQLKITVIRLHSSLYNETLTISGSNVVVVLNLKVSRCIV